MPQNIFKFKNLKNQYIFIKKLLSSFNYYVNIIKIYIKKLIKIDNYYKLKIFEKRIPLYDILN